MADMHRRRDGEEKGALAHAARRGVLSAEIIRLFAAAFAGLANFYALLSVVPAAAAAKGGPDAGGLVTGVLMSSAVIAEFFVPALAARLGYRRLILLGLALLAAPSLGQCVLHSVPATLFLSAVRGAGLGIVFVIGAPVVASLAPATQRAAALGAYGVVAGAAAVIVAPASVWLAARCGAETVCLAAAAAAILGIVVAPKLDGLDPRLEAPGRLGAIAGRAEVATAAAALFLTALATGAVVSFAPAAFESGGGSLAAAALLVHALAAMAARWWAGQAGSRAPAGRLLRLAVATAGLGMVAAATSAPALVLVGMSLLGAGFGVAQNASLTAMFDAVEREGRAAASALWSVAYDAGLGAGGAACGLVAGLVGAPLAFGCCGALLLVMIISAEPLRGLSTLFPRPAAIPCEGESDA